MAFYFALLNVSSKRDVPRPSHRHRRHSIASVESPILDFRMLPRPQVVGQDVMQHNQLMEEAGGSRNERGQRRQRHERVGKNERASDTMGGRTTMKKSESSYATGRRGEFWQNERAEGHERVRDSERTIRSTERASRADKVQQSGRTLEIHPELVVSMKNNDLTPTEGCLLTLSRHQIDSAHSTRDHGERREHRDGEANYPGGRGQRGRGRGRGGRQLIVRRRNSPVESTTSGSRRSSKGSQNSLQRRESPASSVSSRRESEDNRPSPSYNLMQASLKLSGISVSSSKCSEKSNLKKVTFDTHHAQSASDSFLGVSPATRRASGCVAVFRAANQKEGGIGAVGDAWRHEEEVRQNDTNRALEGRPPGLRSCLLRRRSTSDRGSVAIRNRGFMEGEGGTPRHHIYSAGIRRVETTKG